MRAALYDPDALKKPTNLSVNQDLLRQAKALNINLSQALEQRLVDLIREAPRREWLQKNQSARWRSTTATLKLTEYSAKARGDSDGAV